MNNRCTGSSAGAASAKGLEQQDGLRGIAVLQHAAGQAGPERAVKTREPFAICHRPVGVAVFRQQLTRVQIKRGPVILSRPRTQRPLPRGGELIGVDDKIAAERQNHHVVLQAEHVRRSQPSTVSALRAACSAWCRLFAAAAGSIPGHSASVSTSRWAR